MLVSVYVQLLGLPLKRMWGFPGGTLVKWLSETILYSMMVDKCHYKFLKTHRMNNTRDKPNVDTGGDSPEVQCLRLRASTARGSMPGQGTKILHAS